MQMPGRKFSAAGSGYRYGFNGQENSDEIFEGSTTAEYWEYDSRLGRRWNIDPVSKAFLSDYCTFGNNPILYLDPSGADFYKDKKGKIMWIEKHDKIGSTAMINGKKFTNIGTSITVRTNSEIRLPTDIEVGDRVAGSKLINYLTITGNYDKKGKFLGFSSDFQRKTGVTDLGFVQLKGTDGVKGKSNSYESVPNDRRQWGTSATISQHTEVNPLEAPGLKLITGGQLVDVNVRMTVGISFESEFFINIEHGTYPSVRIDIQTQGQPYKAVYDYFQSSFTMSHVKDAMTIFATQKKSNSVHNFQRVFNEYNRKKVNQPFVLFMGFNDGNDR